MDLSRSGIWKEQSLPRFVWKRVPCLHAFSWKQTKKQSGIYPSLPLCSFSTLIWQVSMFVQVTTCALPDNVVISSNGTKVYVACEGEASDEENTGPIDDPINPEGMIAVVDVTYDNDGAFEVRDDEDTQKRCRRDTGTSCSYAVYLSSCLVCVTGIIKLQQVLAAPQSTKLFTNTHKLLTLQSITACNAECHAKEEDLSTDLH